MATNDTCMSTQGHGLRQEDYEPAEVVSNETKMDQQEEAAAKDPTLLGSPGFAPHCYH
jgi:hypothetical protein